MTQSKNKAAVIKSFLIFVAFLIFSVFVSEEVSRNVLNGFLFSVRVILPTVFPFMVFSDLATHFFEFEKSKRLSSIFERCFKISGSGISAFLSGMTGGFPVGAKNALSLYNDGKISKCECERLMSFSNIASPAYVISAVGIGILSDFKIGIILYATVIISAIASGLLIGIKKEYSANKELKPKQNYNSVNSLKSSSAASINVIFFISFFCAICSIIKKCPLPEIVKCLLVSVTEVGNAVAYISDLHIFSFRFSLALIAFSLSFSGISVIMQSLAIEGGKEMSTKKCILYKLIQGAVSFLIILVLPIDL